MSISTPPPPAPPNDSEPLPPSVPADLELWSESDVGGSPIGKALEPVTTGKAVRPAPTIGYVGRYALKHLLGEGGLGAVYSAHDPLLSRLIAVKTLNVEVDESERDSFNAIFLNEARAAGGLSHPHIVTVFDAGVSDQRAYIAMELLKGRDLRQLRQEGWRPTAAQAALLVRRVADALAYAHSKGVIHRDIKPANIFMVGRGQPRVLDFGIAHITHQRGGFKPSALVGGSPYYMAPEQVRSEAGDRRTDVFSLGVVLYELLTDKKPFVGETLDEIAEAVEHHVPPLAHLVDPSVPQALAEICARAMAKEPDERFRSARSFSRDLRQWIELNPSEGDADTAVMKAIALPPAPKPKQRWLIPAIAAGLVLAAGLVYGFVDMLESPALNTPVALAPVAVPAAVTPAPASGVLAGAPVAVGNAVAASSVDPNVAAPATVSNSGPAVADADPTSTSPTHATPTVLAAVVAPVATPPVVTPIAPAVALPLAPKDPKVVLKETPKERKAREARERDGRAQPAPAAVAQTGIVSIAVSPWGQVEVDGAAAGTAPPLHELTLPEGKHQIVIRNTDFPPYSSTITVTAGQPVVIKYKFGS